jgi:hypothetical protein
MAPWVCFITVHQGAGRHRLLGQPEIPLVPLLPLGDWMLGLQVFDALAHGTWVQAQKRAISVMDSFSFLMAFNTLSA